MKIILHHRFLTNVIALIGFFSLILLCNSCGDADKILTPRDIDTVFKPQIMVVRTVAIPFSSLNVSLNGTSQRLLPSNEDVIQAIRYSDSTWGLKCNIALFNTQITSQLFIDSLIVKVSEIKANKSPIALSNIVSSAKDYASRLVLKKAGTSAIIIEPNTYSGTFNAPTLQCTENNGTLTAKLDYNSNGITEIESKTGTNVNITLQIVYEVQ